MRSIVEHLPSIYYPFVEDQVPGGGIWQRILLPSIYNFQESITRGIRKDETSNRINTVYKETIDGRSNKEQKSVV